MESLLTCAMHVGPLPIPGSEIRLPKRYNRATAVNAPWTRCTQLAFLLPAAILAKQDLELILAKLPRTVVSTQY